MVQPDLFTATVQPLLEQYREDFLAEARATGRAIAMQCGEVTVDDIRESCPPPPDVDPRVMGAVLKTPDFEITGYRKSTRRECHNRPIAIFKLRAA